MSPSYTRGYPLVMAGGKARSSRTWTATVFLDCAAGIAVTATGHSHPEVVKAIVDQAQRFLHMSGTDFYYEPQVRLAEEMATIVADPGEVRSFFGNSGTEAVEASLKLARWHTKRHGIIAFLGAFHGRTMGSLSLTSSKAIQRHGFGPLLPGVYHAPYANCYRCPVGLKPETCAAECVGYIEDQTLRAPRLAGRSGRDRRRADPGRRRVHRAAAGVPPAAACAGDEHGMLLVADEVQSGMGRTGKMFAIEHFGVEPDIVATAKGIASGMPLGVCIARADVMAWPPGAHASTFGGNPVSCAAAIATIELLRETLMANAADVGAHLLAGARR